jgi:hypothetical protein
MRRRTLGVPIVSIARTLAVYVAIVVGAAAIGALVGTWVWGEWFVGAGLAVCLAAWLALPTGIMEASGGDAPDPDDATRPRETQHPNKKLYPWSRR